jgi:hypothetical protein
MGPRADDRQADQEERRLSSTPGTHAHVQNHATMGEVATWFPDSSDDIRIDADAVRRRCEKAALELQEGRQKAAERAGRYVAQMLS